MDEDRDALGIGADAVAKAAPDGYTIGIATASTHAVAVSLGTNMPYDPIKDFAPVAMLGSQPYVLVLYPGLPAHDLAQLIDGFRGGHSLRNGNAAPRA